MSQSDDALVRLAQQGQRSAFDELVRRTSRLLYARLYLQIGDAHLAEDLLQEAFLRAHRAIHQLQEPAKLRSWLLTIGHHAATDAARKRSVPRAEGVDVGTVFTDEPNPQQNAEQAEMRGRVLEILRSLPDEYQSPLSLRYIAGADYQTMQTQLGCTNGSLRGLLHRGMKMMREKLTKELGDDFFED